MKWGAIMELNITDLLDDVQDISPDIYTKTVVCQQRVKELTLKKIRDQNSATKRHPVRFAVRVALIAAVLVCLSVTVLAAWWLNNDIEGAVDYDNDLLIGCASKNWNVEGWIIELKAEKVTPIGMTMVCTEWGGQDQSGMLTTDDNYWLECWNGSGYEIYSPEKAPFASGNEATIQKNTTHSWVINWEKSYGTLAPGHYRLGKNFEHISDSGHNQNLVGYVKFRVLDEKMADYYAQYEAAIEMLSNQSNWHLTYQVFPESTAEYRSYAMEIWKSGEDYLQNLSYLDENEAILKHDGTALLDGVGCRLNWDTGAVTGTIVQREIDPSVDKDAFYLWQTFSCLTATGIDEIEATGNTVIYIERADSRTEKDLETVVTFTGVDQLLNIKQYWIHGETKILYSVLTVHGTDPAQIAQTVADQKAEE